MSELNPILQLLIKRWQTYAVLSNLYWREPSPKFLRELMVTVSVESESLELSDGGSIFVEFFRNIDESMLEKLGDSLAEEFAGLFLNASSRPVYPYESVYTSRDGLMMQHAYDEVVREYKQAGLVRDDGVKEPEDHIAYEFAFMSFLSRQLFEFRQTEQLGSFRKTLEIQKRFFEKHLMAWIPQFCHDFEKAAESDFYRGIARYTAEFMNMEQKNVSALMSETPSIGGGMPCHLN